MNQSNNQAVATKKIKNAGRLILTIGIFYSAVLFLTFADGTQALQDKGVTVPGLVFAGFSALSWVILGILTLKNKDNLQRASRVILVTLLVTLVVLFQGLLQGNLNLGLLIVLVLALYLMASYSGLRKLIKP